MILSIEEIKKKKKEIGYTNEQMAALSGLPLATVQKVLGGTTSSPRYKTIKALSDIFIGSISYPLADDAPDLIYEGGVAYAKGAPIYNPDPMKNPRYPYQGHYTVKDYLALPDEQRVELIDGVFYDMGAPSIPHQLIAGAIHAQFLDFLRKKKAKCMVFIAPTDVQIDKDEKTMVQPDVMVVCDRSIINRKRLYGAPDFLIEVLSPSTKNKDIMIKMSKYMNAGVKEYWMVDPMKEVTTKMLFEKAVSEDEDDDITVETFPFAKSVPVTTFKDAISVNFKEIADTYSFLDEQDS